MPSSHGPGQQGRSMDACPASQLKVCLVLQDQRRAWWRGTYMPCRHSNFMKVTSGGLLEKRWQLWGPGPTPGKAALKTCPAMTLSWTVQREPVLEGTHHLPGRGPPHLKIDRWLNWSETTSLLSLLTSKCIPWPSGTRTASMRSGAPPARRCSWMACKCGIPKGSWAKEMAGEAEKEMMAIHRLQHTIPQHLQQQPPVSSSGTEQNHTTFQSRADTPQP